MNRERGGTFLSLKKKTKQKPNKSYSAAALSFLQNTPMWQNSCSGRAEALRFWELDLSAAPPQVSSLHRGSRDKPAPCDAHVCDSHPITAAAAQEQTATPRSPTGCKTLKPKLGILGCWWDQASEHTLALMDVQGGRC